MINERENNGLGWKMWTGIGASFFYAATAVFFLWHNQKYSEHLKLSEVGDYLAGAFSPLAFLWLVIGYLMQNRELSLQLHEFKTATETAKKTLILYKTQDAERQAKEFNGLQPIFSLSHVSLRDTTDGLYLNFRLGNTGGKIFRIKIKQYFDSEILKSDIRDFKDAGAFNQKYLIQTKSLWPNTPPDISVLDPIIFGELYIEYQDLNFTSQTVKVTFLKKIGVTGEWIYQGEAERLIKKADDFFYL